MRLLQECLLDRVPDGGEFLVDGAWYKKLDTRINSSYVELLTEYYKAEDETYYNNIGDTLYFRNDLIVIVEAPD